MWGVPPPLHFAFYNLRLRIGVHQCSSVVTPLGFFCLPPLLALLSLQAMATDSPCATVSAGWRRRRGLGGDAANWAKLPAGWGRSSAPSSVRYNALGDALRVRRP